MSQHSGGDTLVDHRAQLEPVARPLVMTRGPRGGALAIPGVAELAKRQARQVPYRWVGGTVAAGGSVWGMAEAAAGLGLPAVSGAISVGAILLSPAAAAVLRIRYRDNEGRQRIPATYRTRWYLAGAVSVGLVDAAALGVGSVGGGWGAVAWLAALGVSAAGLGGRWMRDHAATLPAPRRPIPIPAPAPVAELEPPPAPAPPPPLDPGTEFHIRWNDRIAGPDSQLKKFQNAKLVDRNDKPTGTRWRVESDPPGSWVFDDLLANRVKIAGILQTRADKLVLERDENDEGCAELTYISRNILAEGIPYPGPQYHDGLVPIGFSADGRRVDFTAWEKGQGVRNGAFIGQMRSGKTASMELVMLSLRSARGADGRGIHRCWWGDGNEAGASSNFAPDAAHWFEKGADGILRQLAAAERLLAARSLAKNRLTYGPDGLPVQRTSEDQKAVREIDPCPDWPGYFWFIPEFGTIIHHPKLQAAKFTDRLIEFLRQAPKFGLAVVIDTQSGLEKDFDSSTVLRGFFTMLNAFAMRSTNTTEQYSIAGLKVSPSTLPVGGGYGFLALLNVLAMFRTWWTPNLHDHLGDLPVCEDDEAAALAISPFLPTEQRMSLASTEAEYQAWLASARAGTLPSAGADTAGTAPASAETTASSSAEPQRWTAGGMAMPIPPSVASLAAARARRAAPPPDDPGPLHWKAKRILGELAAAAKPMTADELKRATELSGPDVSKHGGELIRRGLAHRPTGKTTGSYAAGSAPAAAAERLR